jgi:hypothetical protein
MVDFTLTPAQKAAAAQTKAVKTSVLAASVVDAKPASIPPGEVVKLTNDKGKVEYYVGTYDGKVSAPLKSVSSAVSTVNTQIKKAEAVQATALRTSQKIELAETKQALAEAGLPKSEISKIVKAETAANTAELTQFKGLLAEPMLQYGTRDPATNAFVASTTPTPTPTSLLTYNDPVLAPTIQANITSARDAVAEFQLSKGITEPFLLGGDTTSGINQYAIYQALDNGSIVATKDANGTTTGYTVSPEVAAAKGDQSGLMDATGMSKASARALGLVLNNDLMIGGKANVVVDGKGNYLVYGANGADRYGTQKPLVDTGRVDGQGNKIFAEVSTDNSKRNLVSVVSNYVQQPDGSFKYGGVDSTDYTHIEGFNPIKSLVIAGLAGGLGAAAGALSGLSGTAANTLTGAVTGAAGAGLSGNNVLTGGLLGALGGFSVGELQSAAQAAGGYDNLLSQVGSGDFSSFTGTIPNAGTQAIANVGTTMPPAGPNVTGTDLTNYGTTGTTGLGSNMTYNTSAVGQGIKLGLDSAGNYIDLATNLPFTGSGINFAKDAAGKFILDAAGNVLDAATNLPYKGEGVNLINFDTGAYVQPSANLGDGLLDKVKDIGSNVVGNLGWPGAIAGAGLVGSTVANALTKVPEAPTYTAPLLNNAMMPTNQVTDWNQYYNNLFKRQGVGAGNYLGYDIMNRLGDIPPELMGLLGTSAQATPASGTMPTPTSITPA